MSETATDQLPHPTPEHRLLNVFVGQWAAEGDSYTGEPSPGQPHRSTVNWRSDESYAWLPGEFFLEHRFDALAGDRALRGIEILGYDSATNSYFADFFENYGFRPKYQVSVRGREWTFVADSSRATVLFSEDGNRMTVHWDWRPDGEDWQPLCDRTATKDKPSHDGRNA